MTEKTARIYKEQKTVITRLQASYHNKRIAHAYIFDGETGTGKEEAALFLSRLLLCKQTEENVPCETCTNCRRISLGTHPNVSVIRPQGQEIKKEQMTELISKMTKTGYEPGKKIYIISHADRLNPSAANALLKFLEEPEGDVTAILLTDSYPAILATIQSRCQRIPFSPPSREKMIQKLTNEGLTEALAATVTMVTANMETAVQLANDDQFAQIRKTVLKLVEAANRDLHEALLFIQTEWLPLCKEKEDMERGLDLFLYAYRDMMALKANLQTTPAFPDQQQLFNKLSMTKTYSRLSTELEAILQAKKKLHSNMNRTLLMEQMLLNMQEGLLFV